MNEDNDIGKIRESLDGIMCLILDKAYERMDLIPRVAQYKLDHGLAIHQPEREVEVIAKARQYASEKGKDPTLAERLMRTIIDYSREQEEVYIAQRQQG